jgi:hypothetical protein
MTFRYGISPSSLDRWNDFQRLLDLQQRRGPEVGASLVRQLVTAELSAIARATLEYERRGRPAEERRVWSGLDRNR